MCKQPVAGLHPAVWQHRSQRCHQPNPTHRRPALSLGRGLPRRGHPRAAAASSHAIQVVFIHQALALLIPLPICRHPAAQHGTAGTAQAANFACGPQAAIPLAGTELRQDMRTGPAASSPLQKAAHQSASTTTHQPHHHHHHRLPSLASSSLSSSPVARIICFSRFLAFSGCSTPPPSPSSSLSLLAAPLHAAQHAAQHSTQRAGVCSGDYPRWPVKHPQKGRTGPSDVLQPGTHSPLNIRSLAHGAACCLLFVTFPHVQVIVSCHILVLPVLALCAGWQAGKAGAAASRARQGRQIGRAGSGRAVQATCEAHRYRQHSPSITFNQYSII